MSVVSVVCCQVEVSVTGWSLVQRSPTECGAKLCVIYRPHDGGYPRPLWGLLHKKHKYMSNWNMFFGIFFLSSIISNHSTGYSMSWCAGWLTDVVRSPPARRSLSWIQSLLIDLRLLVNEVSTLSPNLLTTQTMVTTGIFPIQGKSPW
jgi:hypothetical protein